MDEAGLSDDTASSMVKELILRFHLNRIIQQDEAQQIVTGVSVVDMQTDRSILQHNEETAQFAASVNKLPVALLTLQDLRAGKIKMSDVVTWIPSDVRAGGGVYDQPGAPTTATVQEVIFDMLNRSGNTAVRILVNYKLGQAAAVNARLAQYPQIPQTRLQPLPTDPTRFFLGNTTSKEALWILGQLLKTKDQPERFMEHALATNIYTDFGVRSQLAGNDYIVLVNKLGILDDPDGNNRHDVGVIYNTKTHKAYGYSLMTTSPSSSTTATPQAESSLQQMGRYVLRFAGDRLFGRGAMPQPDTLGPTNQKAVPQKEIKTLY